MYRDNTAKTASLGEDVEQLINADLNEKQAVGIATVFDNKLTTATETLTGQMELLGESLSSEIKDLRTEIRDTRTEIRETRTEIRETRTEIRETRTEIRETQAENSAMIERFQESLRSEIRDIGSARRSDRTIIIVMGFGFLGLIATLIGTPFLQALQ